METVKIWVKDLVTPIQPLLPAGQVRWDKTRVTQLKMEAMGAMEFKPNVNEAMERP